jgi:hypothetical protein
LTNEEKKKKLVEAFREEVLDLKNNVIDLLLNENFQNN